MVWSCDSKRAVGVLKVFTVFCFLISYFIITFQQNLSGQDVKLLISGVCTIEVCNMSLVWSKSAHSPLMLCPHFEAVSINLFSILSGFVLDETELRCISGVASDTNCHSVQGGRLELAWSLKSKPNHHWNEHTVDFKSLSPMVCLYRSTVICLHYLLARHSSHETVLNDQCLHHCKQ